MLSTESMRLMKKYIEESQAANKKRLDARLAATTFQTGDLVLVERPTRAGRGGVGKLTYVYMGPYKITKRINELSFEIASLPGRPINHVVHACHLKKYIPRDEDFEDDIIDPNFIPREYV